MEFTDEKIEIVCNDIVWGSKVYFENASLEELAQDFDTVAADIKLDLITVKSNLKDALTLIEKLKLELKNES